MANHGKHTAAGVVRVANKSHNRSIVEVSMPEMVTNVWSPIKFRLYGRNYNNGSYTHSQLYIFINKYIEIILLYRHKLKIIQ